MSLILKAVLQAFLKFLPYLLQFLPGLFQSLRRHHATPPPIVNHNAGNAGDGHESEKVVVKGAEDKPQASEEGKKDFGVSELHVFLRWCESQLGALYCWPTPGNKYSGKGLPGAQFKGVYDCSGFVTCGIFEATGGKLDLRATHNANRLWNSLSESDGTGPCLAFYGLHPTNITHVVVVLPGGRCIGSSRGDSTCTSPAIALAKNARVVYQARAGYRKDLRGFRKLPLKEE